MPRPLFVVDAFADAAFQGNPAAVCLLDEPALEEWMQHVAAEMNLSETAFLIPEEDPSTGSSRQGSGQAGHDGWHLRWFTPTTEVDLCGHATLASAHVLWETDRLAADAPARFHTRSGELIATRDGDMITLDFPATPPEPADAPDGLAEALGIDPKHVGRSRFDYLIEVADAATVRDLAPDLAALGRVDARGVIVTSRGDGSGADFVSRFFAPAAGVDEDPVTGSAHCCLAPYWSAKLGRADLVGYQASKRSGTVRVHTDGDRVRLSGRAVTVLRGELLADPT
jgi:PhzF family phenazine biosynthesis protein